LAVSVAVLIIVIAIQLQSKSARRAAQIQSDYDRQRAGPTLTERLPVNRYALPHIRTVAVLFSDGSLHLSESPNVDGHSIIAHRIDGTVIDSSVSPSGRRVALISCDGTDTALVHLYDIDRGDSRTAVYIRAPTLLSAASWVSVDFLSESKVLVTIHSQTNPARASNRTDHYLANVETGIIETQFPLDGLGDQIIVPRRGDRIIVQNLCEARWDDDGDLITSSLGLPTSLSVVDVVTGQVVATLFPEMNVDRGLTYFVDVQLSGSPERIVALDNRNTIYIWDHSGRSLLEWST